MYQYRNTKTGEVVKTTCKVTGKNWKEIKADSAKNSDQQEPAKNGGQTKDTKATKGKKG